MEQTRIGIIGLGRLGRKHAENLALHIPEARLAGICSVVDDELESVAALYSPDLVTKDYRELFASPDLDAVVIASTSQQHARMVCDAVEAGCRNIYVEKPIAMTTDEIALLRRTLGGRSDVILQVGYNRRFDASVQTAKSKIEEGYLGTMVQVKMINRDPAAMAEFIIKFSPTSGGLVMDMLTHDYDSARWLVGSEAKSVYGLGDAFVYEGLREVGDIDNCALLIEFESGVIGQIETSRNCPYGYHVETELYGSDGALRLGMVPTRDRVTYMDAHGVRTTAPEWFYEYWQPTFLAELAHFVECVREGRRPLVTADDGYRAVEWAIAATEAVRDRKVVRLD